MPANTGSARVLSIDILRGIVMVIMALDHTRDYFSGYQYSPMDLQHHDAPMFFTRWITHFCAPVFIFLSGTSAYLSSQKKSRPELAKFLLTRGIWLIILELTIVRFGWMFNMDYANLGVQVIWAIGWSMIFLSALIFLPLPAIATISLLLIFGHNTFDHVHGPQMGAGESLWYLLHEPGPISMGGDATLFIFYPLVPWVGVMAIGYCFGIFFRQPEQSRNRNLYLIGGSAIALFFVLRLLNIYGDPGPWKLYPDTETTVLSFFKVQKYPPSLLYLLMTLGPAIALMPALEKMTNAAGRFFMVFGKVPMFYYILHIYLIHSMAMLMAVIQGVPTKYFTNAEYIFGAKPGWGYDLPGVYLWWLLAVALLYFPSRWFVQVKAKHKKWWLSYL